MKKAKTGGRQKGTPNHLTAKVKETIHSLTETLTEEVLKDFQSLTTSQKANLLPKLLPFILPKETEAQNQSQSPLIVMEHTEEGYKRVNLSGIVIEGDKAHQMYESLTPEERENVRAPVTIKWTGVES
jgi:hypothetical protein